MYYGGARPEEVAGLGLGDLVKHPELGWYFNIVDRPCDEDADLFDSDDVPMSHRRTLKNAPSIRKVPVANELMDLGLFRYRDALIASGSKVFFPGLKKDWHGKLSGAFSKVFGRYLRATGIKAPRKVLYSFRHTMKDLLEKAKVESKYLQRILGHTTGDGEVTDSYGSDVPLEHIFDSFNRVKFPSIAAKPWQPGEKFLRLK